MTTSVQQQRLRSRLTTAGVCFGAFLLICANSFYTRDWRTVVPQPGQATAEQRPVRSKVAAPVMEATLTEAPVRREPEVTGTLPKEAEPVARPSAAVASAPRVAATSPAQPHTQSAPPRSRVQSKPKKQAQAATAAAAAKPSAPSDAAPAASGAAPVQFQLAERDN